jgi:hypothetical protein
MASDLSTSKLALDGSRDFRGPADRNRPWFIAIIAAIVVSDK